MSRCKLTPRAVKDAVISSLREALPDGTQIYEDLVPRDYMRPSVLVELTGGTLLPMAGGAGVVPLQWTVKLTGLVETDLVHDSHLPAQDDLGWLLQTIWAAGKLKVADRAPNIDRVQLDTSGYDNVVVTLTLSIDVDREELLVQQVPQAQIMEDVAIRPDNITIN